MSKQELKQKGFTIIEVVLVLAIAALIFLMVFIALPALQRSQRDTARKNDVSIVASAVSSWQGNNRTSSAWPSGPQVKSYAENLSGNSTAVKVVAGPTSGSRSVGVADGTVTVVTAAKCSTGTAPTTGGVTVDKGTNRQYATITKLESASGIGYCLDS